MPGLAWRRPPHACAQVSSATGTITTLSGIPNLCNGFAGNGVPAVAAKYSYPRSISISSVDVSITIADTGNYLVRKIVPISKTGIVTTVAGQPGQFVASGDGGPATSAVLASPTIVHANVGDGGNTYVACADGAQSTIRMVTYQPLPVPLSPPPPRPPSPAFTTTPGSIFTFAGSAPSSAVPLQEEQLANLIGLSKPQGVAVLPDGSVLIADANLKLVLKVAAGTNVVSLFAGTYGESGYAGKCGVGWVGGRVGLRFD